MCGKSRVIAKRHGPPPLAGVLPAELAWRREKPRFQAPMRTWMAASELQMFQAIASSALRRKLTDHVLLTQIFSTLPLLERWRYSILAMWERVFGVEW
jgi:hypothetical protein